MSDSFRVFASTCLSAGANCSLNAFNFSSADALLDAIDKTVDELYASPVPIDDLYQPAVAIASDLLASLGNAMYSIDRWPLLADGLALAFTGNFTPIVSITRPWLSKSNVDPPGNSPYALNVISVRWLIHSSAARACANPDTFYATVRRREAIRQYAFAPNNGRNNANGSSKGVRVRRLEQPVVPPQPVLSSLGDSAKPKQVQRHI